MTLAMSSEIINYEPFFGEPNRRLQNFSDSEFSTSKLFHSIDPCGSSTCSLVIHHTIKDISETNLGR